MSKSFAQCTWAKHSLHDIENITARAETEQYCWVGTTHGLYLMKKKGGKVYHMTTKNSVLCSDTITCITTKKNGEVYAGTNNGIIRYDNYAFLLVTMENSSLRSNRITSLACINGTDVYAGTFDGGITCFSDTRSKTYPTRDQPLSNNHVISFEQAGDDSLIALLDHNVRIGIRHKTFTILHTPGH